MSRKLRKLIRETLISGKIRELMQIIDEEHASVFYEDNRFTRRSHILENLP